MKKLLCVLFALILPALTACGNTAAAPAADNAAAAAETSAPAEATEAEALPESCRIWYGAAGTNSDIPLDDRAAYYVSSDFSLRMPDGSYTGLIYNHMTEGVTLHAGGILRRARRHRRCARAAGVERRALQRVHH